MKTTLSFADEISNMMYATGTRGLNSCIQCATCSATCPAADAMDHTPRRLIAMINAGLKDEVLASNTFWTCASCYACSERCPKEIKPSELMYALKRYSIWKNRTRGKLVGPDFSRRFVRTIMRNGKSYEPGYAPAFVFEGGLRGLVREMRFALRLMGKRRIALLPSRVKRLENFRRMLSRIMPLEGIA
ncbi:MAG TPA: 4Fe-4S dicluster domain-containing protein [Gemmatimonadales bacterium]|nr:4Fe-4S dicluster domain-containing protein [Gemmatimonadales bacterium]